jgi:CheY-like chemotaxis protein
MSRILLADDSPHAQRMGERILREEGFEVVSVTDGDTALLRLADVDPDLILADVFLPRKSGFDICRFVKQHPLHRHVRVVLTAGLLEPFDENEAKSAGADAIIKKPFEASAVMDTIQPLIAAARAGREETDTPPAPTQPLPAQPDPAIDQAQPVIEHEGWPRIDAIPHRDDGAAAVESPHTEASTPPAPPVVEHEGWPRFDAIPPAAEKTGANSQAPSLAVEAPAAFEPAPIPVAAITDSGPRQEPAPAAEPATPELIAPAEAPPEIDPDRVRAAVTVALDAAMPALIDEITEKVLIALGK